MLRAFDDLVRAGKIVYAGISDTPAWQVARMQAIADVRGWAPLVALQISYSLAERTVQYLQRAEKLDARTLQWLGAQLDAEEAAEKERQAAAARAKWQSGWEDDEKWG